MGLNRRQQQAGADERLAGLNPVHNAADRRDRAAANNHDARALAGSPNVTEGEPLTAAEMRLVYGDDA